MRKWQHDFFNSAERNLNLRTDWVVKSLSTIPKEKYPAEIKRLSEATGARITLFSIDKQLLEDSSQATQSDSNPDSEELLGALRRPDSYGHAIRTLPGSETYLYVARLFIGPHYYPGLVRLAQPLETSLFRQFELGERLIAGGVASVILVLVLLYTVFTVRRLNRLKQNVEYLTEGEYNHPFSVTGMDEIADLGRVLARLHTRLQKEALDSSVNDSFYSELIRLLPLPLAILRPDFGLKHINSAFREAANIDAATEHARFHSLRSTSEFVLACQRAQATRELQHIMIRLPWLNRKLALQICPLPMDKGHIAWALIIPDLQILVPTHLKEIAAILKQCRSILENIIQGDPTDYQNRPQLLLARFTELRILSNLAAVMQSEERSAPTLPIQIDLLLQFVISEVKPILEESQVQLELIKPTESVEISDNMKRVEYVLLAVLIRTISEIRAQNRNQTEMPHLMLSIEITDTFVICSLAGLDRPIFCADLDRLLAPLGGAMGPLHEESFFSASASQNLPSSASMEPESLWIRLRRA